MRGRVIGVVSFKGGVGKTISAINIGAGLVKIGKRVLLIDGNFLSPSIHIYLGLLKFENSIKEVIRKKIDVRNAIYEHKCGLHIIPTKFYKNVEIEQFISLVKKLSEIYDYIIIDSGPSYTEEIIAILGCVDEIIIVTTPDYPTIASSIRAKKLLDYKKVKVSGVLINRIRKKRFELKKDEIEKILEIKSIAEIPEDNSIILSTTKFFPVVFLKGWSRASREFIKLSKKLVSMHSQNTPR